MLSKFVIIVLSLPLLISFISCERVDESVSAPKQAERIESYLNGSKNPFTIDNGVYRVKTNKVDNSKGAVVEVGDSLYVYFAEYIFKSAPEEMIYTNIKALAEGANLGGGKFSYEPLRIKYGTTDIIKGLEIGLRNSIMGDSLMIYMTSDNAYKNKATGVVPKYSSISMFVYVKNVIK